MISRTAFCSGGPRVGDASGADWADAGDLAELLRFGFDGVEDLLSLKASTSLCA